MDVRAALLVLVLGVLVTSPIWIIGLIRLLRRSAMRALEARQFKLAETRSIPESSWQTAGRYPFSLCDHIAAGLRLGRLRGSRHIFRPKRAGAYFVARRLDTSSGAGRHSPVLSLFG
jgi:hypothetical protein